MPCCNDVRELTADTLARDRLSLTSSAAGSRAGTFRAGLGAGITGERSGLWGSLRLIGELRPSYAILENVAALLDDGMGTVLSETWPTSGMMRSGRLYLRAPWVHHIRQRVFAVAYPNGEHGRRGFGIPLHERSRRYKKSTILRGARARERARLEDPSALYRGADGVSFGWSEIAQSATASILKFRDRSAARSSKQKG